MKELEGLLIPYGRACLRILRQAKMANLVGRMSSPLPYGRVPKGTESLTIHMVRSSPLLSLMVEHPKGTESLTIHMVRVLSLWSSASGPYQSSPLKGRSHSLFIW
jgi:hypothetical protein